MYYFSGCYTLNEVWEFSSRFVTKIYLKVILCFFVNFYSLGDANSDFIFSFMSPEQICFVRCVQCQSFPDFWFHLM